MSKRRTNPSFLSDDEAARESRRQRDMVRYLAKHREAAIIGETENFVVTIDSKDKTIYIEEKHHLTECIFKLQLTTTETDQIMQLLTNAKHRLTT